MTIPVLVLSVFVLVIIGLIFCIITNPKVPIPFINKTLKISYIYPPLVGVIIILITVQLTPWEAIKAGIVGDDKLKPYAILLLILSMSMICSALDWTGALSFFAFHVVSRFVKTRLSLFTLVFILATVFGIFSSSHSVIMTTAPLIMYITTFAKISSIPYLFAGFYAANIASLVLLIGNPTNIIVGNAFDIPFADFTQFMILPAIITLSTAFLMLLLKFHSDLGLTLGQLFCCRPVQTRQEIVRRRRGSIIAAGGAVTTTPTNNKNNNNTTLTTSESTTQLVQQSQSTQQLGMGGYNQSIFNEDDDNNNNTSTQQQQLPQPQQPNNDDNEEKVQVISYDPTRLYLPQLDPSSELKDRCGAVFHTFVLLVALIFMAASSVISDKIELWHIALPASIISMLYCLIAYPFFPSNMISRRQRIKRQRQRQQKRQEKLAKMNNSSYGDNSNNSSIDEEQQPQPIKKEVMMQNGIIINVDHIPNETDDDENDDNNNTNPTSPNNIQTPIPSTPIEGYDDPTHPNYDPTRQYETLPTSKLVDEIANDDDETVGDVAHRELCSYNILRQTPIEICIFLVSMFILVESLVKAQWVQEASFFILALVGGRNSIALESVNPLGGRKLIIVIIFSIVTVVLSNLLSAQPATIFLTRVLLTCQEIVEKYQQDGGMTNPTGINIQYRSTMAYTVIAVSNYAGLLTFIGSISGIIFAKIVNAKISKQEKEYQQKLEQLIIEQHRRNPRFFQDAILFEQSTKKGRRLQDLFNDDDEQSKLEKREKFTNEAAEKLDEDLKQQLPIYFDDKITYSRFASKGAFSTPFIALGCGIAIIIASFYATGLPK